MKLVCTRFIPVSEEIDVPFGLGVGPDEVHLESLLRSRFNVELYSGSFHYEEPATVAEKLLGIKEIGLEPDDTLNSPPLLKGHYRRNAYLKDGGGEVLFLIWKQEEYLPREFNEGRSLDEAAIRAMYRILGPPEISLNKNDGRFSCMLHLKRSSGTEVSLTLSPEFGEMGYRGAFCGALPRQVFDAQLPDGSPVNPHQTEIVERFPFTMKQAIDEMVYNLLPPAVTPRPKS
ncbi:hypothetical protein HYV84_05930 [Candidatus Woesearchaeota archaeon]|nr:hypothetical protein [Candidatus Woesearchaeota archaeon]